MAIENDNKVDGSIKLSSSDASASKIEEFAGSAFTQDVNNFLKGSEKGNLSNLGLPSLDLSEGAKSEAAKSHEQKISSDDEPVKTAYKPLNSDRLDPVSIPGTGRKVEWPPAEAGAKVDFYLKPENSGSGKLCLMAQSGGKTWLYTSGTFENYWREKK